MDFKKFASDAGTFINRAKQFTEEKLGQAEKTELDAQFENLIQRSERTRIWTEKMISHTESVLQPNPTVRMETFLYDKLGKWDGKKPQSRETNSEALGQTFLDAGGEFGPGTQYGSALIKCGQTEQKLGQAERELLVAAANNFLQPLRAFLDGDMKTVQKERRVLEMKRLDLDACKTRLRRAKSIGAKDQTQDQIIADAEQELRVAQSEFDRQAEITKLLLEGISSTHAHHLRCLHDLIEAQTNYYAQCHQYMSDLQRQLGRSMAEERMPELDHYSSASAMNHTNGGGVGGGNRSNGLDNNPAGSTSPGIAPPLYPNIAQGGGASAPPAGSDAIPCQKAKVLYDYDAADASELSLRADEVITVYSIPGHDDWMTGERGTQRGRVPTTYLTLLN